jgi:CRISPR-associated protein Cmr6
MTNASFIFYRDKDFGRKLDHKSVRELLNLSDNRLSKRTKIHSTLYREYFKIKGTRTFRLTTTYPGLISGSGYNHPSVSSFRQESDNSTDFQLGFYFDHTTGMPIIAGSTVKGVVKSVFPKEWDKGKKAVIKDEKLKYINHLLANHKDHEGEITETNWEDIFFPKGAVFHDAFISGAPDHGQIFAEDYITPHKDGLFKNPIPIRFLKIAPEVTFTFQFTVKDTSSEGIKLTVDHKLHVFKQIILDFGLGAKRNVGYGNFIDKND